MAGEPRLNRRDVGEMFDRSVNAWVRLECLACVLVEAAVTALDVLVVKESWNLNELRVLKLVFHLVGELCCCCCCDCVRLLLLLFLLRDGDRWDEDGDCVSGGVDCFCGEEGDVFERNR